MVHPITLHSKEDVLNLNNLATKQKFNLSVSNGSIIVDAKSLLALFSLIGKTVNLVASDSADPVAFAAIINKLN